LSVIPPPQRTIWATGHDGQTLATVKANPTAALAGIVSAFRNLLHDPMLKAS
jgi:hypothetical protein